MCRFKNQVDSAKKQNICVINVNFDEINIWYDCTYPH